MQAVQLDYTWWHGECYGCAVGMQAQATVHLPMMMWTKKTHGHVLTQLLWLHRHSLLCLLTLTCICGQKMITDCLPCSIANNCMFACKRQCAQGQSDHYPNSLMPQLSPATHISGRQCVVRQQIALCRKYVDYTALYSPLANLAFLTSLQLVIMCTLQSAAMVELHVACEQVQV